MKTTIILSEEETHRLASILRKRYRKSRRTTIATLFKLAIYEAVEKESSPQRRKPTPAQQQWFEQVFIKPGK